MMNWINSVSKVTGTVNQQWDRAKRRVNQKLGIQEPIHIMPYRGYGTVDQFWLKGRVLQDEGIAPRDKDDPIWQNALNMYRRFETDEIPNVQVRAKTGERSCCTTTNKEGFFELELEPQSLPGSLWQPVQLEILTDDYPMSSQHTQGEAIIVSEQAEFGVISDIDDTVVRTAATELFKMIRIAYLGNERTRHNRDRTAQLSDIGDSLQQLGIPFIVFTETATAVDHATERGWIMHD